MKSLIGIAVLGLITYASCLFIGKFFEDFDPLGTGLNDQVYSYPANITISRNDGSTIEVSLLAKNSSHIQIKRDKDDKMFVYPIESLDEETVELIEKFPEDGIENFSDYSSAEGVEVGDLYVDQLHSEIRTIEDKIERLSMKLSATSGSAARRALEKEIEELRLEISNLRAKIAESQ